MKRQNLNQLTPSKRNAFTLLELLAVVVIISILLALILPAISGAMRSAEIKQASADITRLETAITAFSSDHNGVQPWSELVLTEDPSATGWTNVSRTRLRRIWPQFSFVATHDFNGDGDTGDVIAVTASEALVLFLGGVKAAGTEKTLVGFSKNPINPIARSGENRTIPYEFDVARLIDSDGDGMLEYTDTLGDTPYLYVSSNNGQGYSRTDGSLNYYVQPDGTTPWNKSTFQIISAGADGEFGFDPAPNPFNSSGGTNDSRPKYGEELNLTLQQRDNVANFNPGVTLGQ